MYRLMRNDQGYSWYKLRSDGYIPSGTSDSASGLDGATEDDELHAINH